jgi:hypothetical protein
VSPKKNKSAFIRSQGSELSAVQVVEKGKGSRDADQPKTGLRSSFHSAEEARKSSRSGEGSAEVGLRV